MHLLAPRIGLAGLVTAAGALAGLATIAAYAGALWWRFDQAAQFRFQYLVVLSLIALLQLALRHRRRAAIFAVLACVNLLHVLPLYLPAPTPPAGKRLRVMLINVNAGNDRYAETIAEIERIDPDVLLVEELTWRWERELLALERRYPNDRTRPQDGVFGIGLYSKYPIVASELPAIGRPFLTSVRVRLDVDGYALSIVGVHPPPPVTSEFADMRDDLLSELPLQLDREDAVLLMGDLNATRWSHAFRRLLRETGLRDSARGFGFDPTWPMTPWWLAPLRIPIDHCLHSPEIVVVDRATGPSHGSDHRSLIVDVALPGDRLD